MKIGILHRYIISEVIPQFFSALIIVCTILIVSQLIRLSDMLVALGITFENVFLPILYIVLPFLPLMIPIAFLAAVLIAFGRFSADGEYAAMLAAGFSLRRSAIPIFITAGVLYCISAYLSAYLEPWGRRELTAFYHRKTQTELDNIIKFKMQPGVFLDNFLGYVFYAEKISEDRTKFDNVMIAPRGGPVNSYFVLAPSANLVGSVNEGNLRMVLHQGVVRSANPATDESTLMKFQKTDFDLLHLFSQQILGDEELSYDYRSFPPSELSKFVRKLESDPERNDSLYYRAKYLYHQRFGTPFAVIIFAFFGLVLGVTDPRKGKNIAYVYAIGAIIFGYVVVFTFKWFGEKGSIDAFLAAWIPNILLTSIGIFLLYQKNRLPPSESVLDPVHIPLLNQWYKRFKERQS